MIDCRSTHHSTGPARKAAQSGEFKRYWYDSQLAGEGAPQFDRHVHPTEPRSLCLPISYRF
jgi:hypothetical protein